MPFQDSRRQAATFLSKTRGISLPQHGNTALNLLLFCNFPLMLFSDKLLLGESFLLTQPWTCDSCRCHCLGSCWRCLLLGTTGGDNPLWSLYRWRLHLRFWNKRRSGADKSGGRKGRLSFQVGSIVIGILVGRRKGRSAAKQQCGSGKGGSKSHCEEEEKGKLQIALRSGEMEKSEQMTAFSRKPVWVPI